MELSTEAHYVTPKVSCCLCGLLIDSNPSNMCPTCIRNHVNITDGLVTSYTLTYCPECERYLQPPKYWSHAALESRELMTICLKRIRGLAKYTLVDASFIWTEPHSKRLKLKVTLQQEIFTDTVIQQTVQIEYEVMWQQCPACQKAATGQPQWDAVVQLRQKVSHKRTFLHLEQLILKHRMHEDVTRIEAHPAGMDFFYGHKSQAQSFVEFISALAPVNRIDACQLVSHDSKTNTAVEHHTFSLEICPLCREDLVLLPRPYYNKMGGLGPMVLVHKVHSSIVFLDPQTLRAGEITGTRYWKHSFMPFANSRAMTEFYVIDITPTGVVNGKFTQGMATVCLSSEVGSGKEWVVSTHLGAILKPGDLAMGYHLESLNANHEDEQKWDNLPDVILVRKYYPSQAERRNRRAWKLKQLDVLEKQGQSNKDRAELEREKEEFADEVERDPELRKDIMVFKDPIAMAALTAKQTRQQQQYQEQMNKETAAQTAAAPVVLHPSSMAPAGYAGLPDIDEDDEAPVIALEELMDDLEIGDTTNNNTVANNSSFEPSIKKPRRER